MLAISSFDSVPEAPIYLVRHGTHDEIGKRLSGRSEIPLNARGHSEAEMLAERLERIPIASIHSSPRRRAFETAQPIAARRGLAVHVAPALDEIDFGAFAGRAFALLDGESDWTRWNAERDSFRCPGGETMAEVVARAEAYLAGLAPASRPALCVTHCDVIRGLAAARLRLGFERMLTLDCGPASVTILEEPGMRPARFNARALR